MFLIHHFRLLSNKITSTIVYDDPTLGVMVHHNPRGRPQKKPSKATVDLSMEEKVKELREDMLFGDSKKMVLIVSFSTDEMIREVNKYPEVWYMDVTGRANRQKRELFLMVVRKPSGECAIGNAMLIPSGICIL